MQHLIKILEKQKPYWENEYNETLQSGEFVDGKQLYRDLTLRLDTINAAIRAIESEYHITDVQFESIY